MTSSSKKLKNAETPQKSGINTIRAACFQQSCFLIALAALFLAVSCSSDPPAEQIIEDFLTKSEQAAENGNGRQLRKLIANAYSDNTGRTKQDIDAVATGYLLRNKKIYCFRLTDSVRTNDDGSISAKILTALAARPITDISLLPTINSDIYWFDITIAREDKEWGLIAVSWQQALLEDFFQ